MSIDKKQLKSLVGKHVCVMTRDGRILDGILDKIENDTIYVRSKQIKGEAQTSAFFPFFNPVTPLVLFDLLAIAELEAFRRPFFFPFI